ncbi:MAG TPA: hypothetical protein VFV05_18535 [Methylomirabilota bacterium]|nr:hypothetical protein [Methylomirabilota bacterium]
MRSDFRLPSTGERAPSDRPRWLPGIAVVALAALAAVLLVAQPTHEMPPPAGVALAPPPPFVSEPAALPVFDRPPARARHARVTLVGRPPSLRRARYLDRPQPRATMVHRTRSPGESGQSP